MRIIHKPSLEELRPLISEGTHGGQVSMEEWHTRFLNGVYTMLNSNPKLYRVYGIYWWILKKLLTERGFDLGDNTEQEWIDAVDYGDTAYNLCAIFAYYDYYMANCLVYAQDHPYYYHDTEVDDDAGEICWEQAVYHLADDDMETRDPQ